MQKKQKKNSSYSTRDNIVRPRSWDDMPLYVDIPYICILMARCNETVRQMCANGELPATKFANEWRISKYDFIAFMESQKQLHKN